MYEALNKELSEISYTFSKRKSGRHRGSFYSEQIICFDIETTTAFYVDGKWQAFDMEGARRNPEVREKFRKARKLSCCYIWQCSIEGNVFIGRRLEDFRDFLSELNHYCPYIKIIYVHNLPFEFHWLQNVLRFDEVFARKEHKAMTASVNKYQVEFRCSYFLTRLSLADWAKGEKLSVQKLVGELNYNVLRTPATPLTVNELQYCINDVLVMFEGLKKFREQYEFIWNIPLTQTGKVRRKAIAVMKPEIAYRRKMSALVPKTLDEYREQVDVFLGGSTHANYIYANRVVKDVHCFDISSSYPYTQVVEQFPMTKFVETDYSCKYLNNPHYSYIIRFRCTEIVSKLYNTFWSVSKAKHHFGAKLDNGRIMRCIDFEAVMISTDFEIFCQCYEMKGFDVLDFKIAINDYLNPTYRKYILDIYGGKTTLKNVEGMEAIYHAKKEECNSNFGMSVTKDITDDIVYDNGIWDKDKLLTEEQYAEKADKVRRNLSKRVSSYMHGVYVAGYGRRNLWKSIIALDEDVVYFDTDSNKNVADDLSFFDEYNRNVIEVSNKCADQLGISRNLFEPKDIDGNPHRLGIYEREMECSEFVTLGAKKYCYRTMDGVLHQTVSGVRKSAVDALGNDINKFQKDFMYDEISSKKLLIEYCNNQEGDYLDGYYIGHRYAIHAIPTTYELGLSLDYLALVADNRNQEVFTEIIDG